MSDTSNVISFEEFAKVELRVGKVLESRAHPNADKLLVLKVDLGSEQRQLVAGLKGYYTPEELLGRSIIVVANLAPRMMRGEESQGMLLAAVTDDRSKVIHLAPAGDVPPGTKVS
jgi:methionyl-tRNA synthetase